MARVEGGGGVVARQFTFEITYPGAPRKVDTSRIDRAIVNGVVRGMGRLTTLVNVTARRILTRPINGRTKSLTGVLAASLRQEIKSTYSTIEATAHATAAYAQWVEFGRRGTRYDPTGGNPNAATASWPPRGAIERWVRLRYRELAPLGRTAAGVARRGVREQDAVRSLAYSVARKIFLRGVPPFPFMRPGLAYVMPRGRAVIEEEVLRALAATGSSARTR